MGAGLLVVAGVCVDRGLDCHCDSKHLVAAELLCAFHRVGGNLCGVNEAPAPDFDQGAVQGQVHEEALCTTFDAVAAHLVHLSARLGQSSCPGQCQGVGG